MTALAFERGFAVFNGMGYCLRILDELIAYAKETGVMKKAEIRQKLADIATDIEAFKLICYETIWKMSQGKEVIHEPARDKVFQDMVQERLSVIGTEITGAYAQVKSLDETDLRLVKVKGVLEHLYWLIPGTANAGGTTDTMRNIVGQVGLGLPRAY